MDISDTYYMAFALDTRNKGLLLPELEDENHGRNILQVPTLHESFLNNRLGVFVCSIQSFDDSTESDISEISNSNQILRILTVWRVSLKDSTKLVV